ncbi:MAG: hypothetical protein WD053_02270 [Gracilimonas sp.]
MAYLRWIYKSWNVFWTFIGVLVLTVAIVLGTIFGAMQLQPVKDRIAIELEQQFSEKYEGVLTIGSIKGFLPFSLELEQVKVYQDSFAYTPVLESSEISAALDVWSLFRNRMIIKSLRMEDPVTYFDPDSEFSIHRAFETKTSVAEFAGDSANEQPDFGFQVIIPSVIIQNGDIVLRNISDRDNNFTSTDSLHIRDLQMDMFFEFTEDQRFIDINRVLFNTPEAELGTVEMYGQIYNDDQFFELNAFNIISGNSTVRFSTEADNVNILEGNIGAQFAGSNLSLIVDRFWLEPAYLNRLLPGIPEAPEYLQASLVGQGTLDSFSFGEGELILGESYTNFSGNLENLTEPSSFLYEIDIESLILDELELGAMQNVLAENQIEAIAATRYSGMISGRLDSTHLVMNAQGDRGLVNIDGDLEWGEEITSTFNFSTDSLDLGYLLDPRIQRTNLRLQGEFKSSSFDPRTAKGGLVVESDQGMMDNRDFDQIYLLANWDSGYLEPELRLDLSGALFTASGWLDIREEMPRLSLQGSADGLQLDELIQRSGLNPVQADIEYDMSLTGSNLDNVFGELSFDVLQAISEGDTLGRHQLYVDFNTSDSEDRIFRLTSTAFDVTTEGNFEPSSIVALWPQWREYFQSQINNEILFNEGGSIADTTQITRNQSLDFSGRVKNPGILDFYFSDMPQIASSARISSSLNINSQQLLFNTSFNDQFTQLGDFMADSLVMQVTGGFRRGVDFKDFSNLQIQAGASAVDYDFIQSRNVDLVANLREDSLEISTNIADLSDGASLSIAARGRLLEDAITMQIREFDLGTDSYNWISRGIPTITYRSDEKLVLSELMFESDAQLLEVDGTFSASPEDSVNYNVNAIDLDQISDIVGGRLSFGGIMNGRFTTRTLTSVPTVFGDIDIETLSFGGSLVGDLNLSSSYDSDLDRFDTNISVSTDSAKYPEYFENSGRRGQQFTIDGYVLAPDEGQFPAADSLYNFDIDFENIDLWILPLIGPKVFAEGSGLANGKGKIWGNTDTYDFNADFMVGSEDAAYVRPLFLDTYYYAQGEISFTRDDGLTFKDIYLIDPSGGNAILSGYYDFNDFAPTDSMNISLEMDEFQFLNSSFDPTAAFFGSAYGSSTVTISGTNFDPVLRTEEPMYISDFSEISIPLLEETDFNEDNRFIRFVNSFDADEVENRRGNGRAGNGASRTESSDEVDLSFAERFTLDLQFVAENPMTVRLIFDPVTGDIVTAEGTGRLRILLEDEEVSMFGRFDIEGGRYQFVSGDIFTRRFELESGGSIVWEGDPANARFNNLNAVYSARPDITTLSSNSASDPENSQRVPVDLVLNIGGTISSIENNFFFRLPDTFESQQNSTLSTQIASINRDEDLKLLQAANFMLMGNFIPVSSSGQTQNNLFGENLSGSAAVLNPLLSSQVINPLLSNQVNSLLNSDLSSLDVDFNLNTYNQVDLGVALRLYNDKLILRREGQITGRQSNIGDLGATYRINRTFALTAFHRQDLSFGTLSSTEQSQQSQDINGLGFEAKVSFNTWDDFFKRLFSPFRKLFGSGEKESESEQNQEDLTEIRRDRDPA